jgi:hypothetical protein
MGCIVANAWMEINANQKPPRQPRRFRVHDARRAPGTTTASDPKVSSQNPERFPARRGSLHLKTSIPRFHVKSRFFSTCLSAFSKISTPALKSVNAGVLILCAIKNWTTPVGQGGQTATPVGQEELIVTAVGQGLPDSDSRWSRGTDS